MRNFRILILALQLIAGISSITQAQIKFLNHDWLIYDNETKQLYPFVKKNKEDLPLHLSLKKADFKGLFLRVKSREIVACYINNKFFKEMPSSETQHIPVDSLGDTSPDILISFFGKYNTTLIDSIAISYSPVTTDNFKKTEKINLLKKRDSKSLFAILLLVSGAIFVFFKTNYSKAFDQYLNFQDLFLNFRVEPTEGRGSFEGYYFAFVLVGSVFFSLACSGLPLVAGKYSDTESYKYYLNVLNFILVAWFFYFLKYAAIQLISWVFSIPKFAALHFKVFVRIALLWSLVLVLVNMLGQSEVGNFANFLLKSFLVVSLFFLTLISFKITILINQAGRISTLYLISYLCLTEWLPYFVILKLYMVYFY